MQARADLLTVDRAGDLDAALGIARHQIGRGDIHFFIRAAAEYKDAGMLEKTADDAGDRNVFRMALDAGQQAADAPHDHFDPNACAGRLPQLLDHIDVGQGVELEQDVALAALGDLLVHQREDMVLEAIGRDEQTLVFPLQIAKRHVVEKRARVHADMLVGGDERHVGILRGGFFVVIACTDLGDIAQARAVLAGDQADFGVDLVVLKAVDNLAAGLLQPFGPVDVVLLVETGAQLDQHGHILAVFCGRAQVFNQLGLARETVDRDADGDNVRVACGLADHLQERLHGFIRIGKQDVLFERRLEQALPSGQHARLLWRERRVGKRSALLFRQVLAQAERIRHFERRPARQKNLRVGYLEAGAEVFLEVVADRAVEFNAHHGHTAALAQELFHPFAEVPLLRAERFVVRIDVRVAGDAEHGFFQHVVHLEHMVRVFEQDILDRNVLPGLAGQEHQRGQRGGYGQQAEALVFLMGQQSGDVQHLALQMRERVVRIHDLRRQHGRHHIFEIVLDVLLSRRVQLADVQTAQALAAQPAFNVGKRGVPPLVQRLHRRVNAAQLLAGGHAGFVVNVVFIDCRHVVQAADADHKKFVQIAGEYGKKLQPFEQGDALILRLGQHACVELQPRQLAVLCITLFPNRLCHAVPLFSPHRAAAECAHGLHYNILLLLYRISAPIQCVFCKNRVK